MFSRKRSMKIRCWQQVPRKQFINHYQKKKKSIEWRQVKAFQSSELSELWLLKHSLACWHVNRVLEENSSTDFQQLIFTNSRASCGLKELDKWGLGPPKGQNPHAEWHHQQKAPCVCCCSVISELCLNIYIFNCLPRCSCFERFCASLVW